MFAGIPIEHIKNTEKKLLFPTTNTFVVVDTINGAHVNAIFSTYERAYKHMTRIKINASLGLIADNLEDYDVKDFDEAVNSDEYYSVIPIHHIDPSKPIYKMESGNYRSYGDPTEYLTNDLSYWRKIIKGLGYGDDWLEQCTLDIDPQLPPLTDK